ncbi:uncharacterized protein J3D65DRAFT_76712 [Phyllosticta citribraziliensis]|uniref:Uncharacterized protein n=1 Tax=Phyllosticta citribraziliensis TaxID=989973 RepID=A0ABR1LDF3_9PEZI
MAFDLPFSLKNPALLQSQSYIHGQWKDAASGKTFEVIGQCRFSPSATPHRLQDYFSQGLFERLFMVCRSHSVLRSYHIRA